MNDEELKTAFAEQLLKHSEDAFKAAQCVFPDDMGLALRITHEWVHDPFVIAEQARLIEELGESHFLPTKEHYAREVYATAQTIRDPDSKHKFYKLYGEIMGFIEKPSTNINTNVNNNVANRIMVVRESASNDDWEKALLKQQEELANASK